MITHTDIPDGVRLVSKPLAESTTVFRCDIPHDRPGQAKVEILSLDEKLGHSEFMTFCNEVSLFRKECTATIERMKRLKSKGKSK
jgi:hypothetical protein